MATSKKAKLLDKRIKPSTGHSPAILGKGTAHAVKTKYNRKEKHSGSCDTSN